MYWTDDDGVPASPAEARFILSVITVCTVIFGALIVALWFWSRGGLLWAN